MLIMKKYLICLWFLLPIHIFAQNQISTQKLIQQRTKECVSQLNDYMSALTAKTTNGHPSLHDRYEFRSAILSLLVNDGDSLMLRGGSKIAPVMVETVSVNSSGRQMYNVRPAKVYFDRVIDLIKYGTFTDISVDDCEIYVFDISSITKVGDENYIWKYKNYKSLSDIGKGIYDEMTILSHVCMCCDCQDVSIKIGNLKIKEVIRL